MRKARQRTINEEAVWRLTGGEWRVLHGSISEQGASVEWHDFILSEPLLWSESFHPDSLEIVLNFQGKGVFDGAELTAGQAAVYTTGERPAHALRVPGSWHRFLTIEVTAAYLRSAFQSQLGDLLGPIREFCEHPRTASPVLLVSQIPASLLSLRSQMIEPQVVPEARPHWYRAKILEVFSHFLFNTESRDELFCQRQQRINRERVDRVLNLLERDMSNPPTLEMLAAEVGCSPFHLSRIFSEHTGQTIPAFLRGLRISRAAHLLRATASPVTEIAFTVGYSSLGAFNKAFANQIGCSPSLFRKQT